MYSFVVRTLSPIHNNENVHDLFHVHVSTDISTASSVVHLTKLQHLSDYMFVTCPFLSAALTTKYLRPSIITSMCAGTELGDNRRKWLTLNRGRCEEEEIEGAADKTLVSSNRVMFVSEGQLLFSEDAKYWLSPPGRKSLLWKEAA